MLFCEIHPVCYEISLKKEICKRHIKDMLSDEKFAKTKSDTLLPNVVASYSCNLIKRSKGVDLRLQENKAVNIRLACEKLDKLMIHPNEIFSFWHTVGKTTKEKGYKDGRVIIHNKLIPGLGGGLCNLGNTIHYMVLHSPLTVTEFHHHSDALAPEEGKRVPFSTGTSISYNYIDYRFRNNTGQTFQLVVFTDDKYLNAELRSEKPLEVKYHIQIRNEHFVRENGVWFRCGEIWRECIEKSTGKLLESCRIKTNHARVMYDEKFIDRSKIRN